MPSDSSEQLAELADIKRAKGRGIAAAWPGLREKPSLVQDRPDADPVEKGIAFLQNVKEMMPVPVP